MTERGILRAGICGVAGIGAHTIVRLLIRPLLVLVRSLLILILLLVLVPSLLTLVLSLLILVLLLLARVVAWLILVLPRRVLRLDCSRLVLTETRPHVIAGAEIKPALRMQNGRGQTEKQNRSGDGRRRTHSFRVPGPVHKSFSRL
jgi:Mg2+/Co2+ transporter CorB